MLDKVIKTFSILSPFLIFCGVLKLIIYYSAFNINIVDFLSFSEIITSFLDDINILLSFAATMLLITFMTMNVLHKNKKIKFDEIISAFLNIIYSNRYKYALFFAITITTLSILIYFDILGFNYFVIYFIVFCTLQFLSYLIMTKDENNEIDFSDFGMGVSIVLTIITAVFLFAKHDIQVVSSNKCQVNIMTDNYMIECNNITNNVYLGKTDSYTFIKIDSTNSCISIPTSEIKKIEFKSTN